MTEPESTPTPAPDAEASSASEGDLEILPPIETPVTPATPADMPLVPPGPVGTAGPSPIGSGWDAPAPALDYPAPSYPTAPPAAPFTSTAAPTSAAASTGATPSEAAALLERTLFEIKRVIVGQDRMVERVLVSLLAKGHCLLEGVPGVAKTLTVETLATAVGGSFVRIQFTPDLVPSDIVGTRIYRPSTESFDIELGPIFANFVLADEINRAPAKVQSALLEVMAEHHVSIGGITHDVPSPFLVLATQNPIESEGVYPLPEAQRDRFLMKIDVPLPSGAEEMQIVQRMGTKPPHAVEVLSLDDLATLQQTASNVFVHHQVADYAVRLVLATREPDMHGLSDIAPYVAHGGSPRASLGLVAAGRALALMRGRDYVVPQDVFDVAPEVLRHRLVLSYEALAASVTADDVVNRILSTVVAPSITPSQDPTAVGAVPTR